MRRTSGAMLFALLISFFATTTTRADDQHVINHLVMRERVITISQNSNGELLYSVSSQDGRVLDANLKQEQLQAKYPEIHESIRPAIAGEAEKSNQILLMLE